MERVSSLKLLSHLAYVPSLGWDRVFFLPSTIEACSARLILKHAMANRERERYSCEKDREVWCLSQRFHLGAYAGAAMALAAVSTAEESSSTTVDPKEL